MKKFVFFLIACCCLAQYGRAVKPIDRGLKKSTFIPKGQWMVGGTFSYSEHEEGNYRFLVLENVATNGYSFKVSPYCGYFFRDNVAAGLRFTYSRNYTDLSSLDINLGDDLSFNLSDLGYLEHQFSSTGFLRTYMALGSSRVFGFFNEARLTYGYGQGKNTSGKGEDYTGTYQTIQNLQVGFAPGLTAFISDFAAVEVSVGVMGFNFKWIDQTTNQVETGRRRVSSGNFKIDLFSINIGMTFYL